MLTLPVKKKWFDMILNCQKFEEYLTINEYWKARLEKYVGSETYVCLRSEYRHNSPSCIARVRVETGEGLPEWGAIPHKKYFVLRIIAIKEAHNLKEER